MTATGPEQNQNAQQLEQLKAEVARQTAQAVMEAIAREEIKDRAKQIKDKIDRSISKNGEAPSSLGGDRNDKDSDKGMAQDVKVAVQRVLIATQGATPKELVRPGTVSNSENANRLLNQISANIKPESVTEQNAPYLYELITSIINGETSLTALSVKFGEIRTSLYTVSSPVYKRLQQTLIDYSKSQLGASEVEAKQKFFQTEEEQARKTHEEVYKKSQEQLSLEDEKVLGDLLNRVRASLGTVADGDKYVKSLLRTGEVPEVEIRSTLESKGFSQGEIDSVVLLSSRVRGSKDYEDPRRPKYGHLREFGLLSPDLVKLFSLEGLKEYLKPDSKGQLQLTDLGRRTLKRQALYTLNRLMSKVDNNPDTDFHSNFSDLREGMAYFELQSMIESLQRAVMDDPSLKAQMGDNFQDLHYFISKGVVQELAREKSLRELFHTMGIYIKTLGPDKIAEFVARYNLSDIDSIVTSDFSGKLISLAMSEYERYLKFDIAKNKGQLRTGLFGGKSHLDLLYKDNDDRTNLRERLRSTLEGLQRYTRGDSFTPTMRDQIKDNSLMQRYDIENIEGFEDWELDRALKYAQGIQLTQTIRGFEVIASSRPPTHFRGSADNMVDMAGILNPHWRWQLGRGGPRKMPRYREALVGEMIVKRPEMNFFKRVFGDKWDPKAFHEKYKSWNEDKWMEQWGEIEDKWLYRDMNFQRMIKLLGLGGLAGRGGWRLTGFKEGIGAGSNEFQEYVSSIQTALQEATEQRTGEKFAFGKDWEKTYESLAKSVGVGSRFFFDLDRAKAYAQSQLWKTLGLNPDNLSPQEKEHLWDEYTYGKYGNKEIMTLSGGEKVTAQELVEIKGYVFRGMNLQALMERSPMDLMNSVLNISPELLPKSMGGDKDDYYFEFDEHKLHAALASKSPGDREGELRKVKTVQNNLRRMWGETNYEHLKYIRGFYEKIYVWGMKQDGCLKADGKTGDSEKIFEKMYRIMDLATEKVRLRNAITMDEVDVDDPDLREIFFGGDGLVTHFRNLKEDFGVSSGKDASLGKKGFFYHMGRAWYNELGNNFPPDTTDVDWRFILHNMGSNSGENMVKRLWGDLNAYNGVMGKLMGFDDLLARCAHTHSLEELYKLHGEIRGLKGIAGDEAVYEMQFYLAQIAARYFQEHHSARMPFLLGGIYGLFNGKELSLSKIYGGKSAMTLTTDGLNAYFQFLQHNDLIAEEGIYGFDRLAQSLGADWQKLVLAEILPNVSTALALYLLWKYMKDAMDESDGKKKK